MFWRLKLLGSNSTGIQGLLASISTDRGIFSGSLAEPLLVDLGVSAVVFDLLEALFTLPTRFAVLGEGYTVLLAGRDGLDDLQAAVAGLGLVRRDREVVDDASTCRFSRALKASSMVSKVRTLAALPLSASLSGPPSRPWCRSVRRRSCPERSLVDFMSEPDFWTSRDWSALKYGSEKSTCWARSLVLWSSPRSPRVVEVGAEAGDDAVERDVLERAA